MEVTCTDESTVSVTSGDGWRTRPGQVSLVSMYEGETLSPSEDPRAWMRPGYDDADWAKARTATDAGSPLLQRQIQEPVVITAEIRAEVVSRTARQVVLDMGQVISGWCRYELAESVAPAKGPIELIARLGVKQ